MKLRLIPILLKHIQEAGFEISTIGLEKPANSEHGDWATNIAFSLSKQLRKAPVMIANELANALNGTSECQKIGVFTAVNGFLNLRLNDTWIAESFTQYWDDAFQYPKDERRLLLEYVSANPTGPLHIGHGRWAVLGSVIERMLKAVGVNVETEFYINDAGHQISKLNESVEAVRQGKPVPEDGYHGTYIHEIVASSEEPSSYLLSIQKATLAQLGVTFNQWFSEKSLYQTTAIQSVIDRLKAQELAYENEGALWFKTTAFSDDKDRVLIKSDGAYTYFLVDLAYHLNKISRGYSTLVNIWGADHHGYVGRMKAGVAALSYSKPVELNIVIGQLVTLLKDGEPFRMSKRTGDMVTLQEVIDDIGVDATRYFLAEKSADTHIDFDIELAKKQSSDNPVFYVQYAHARMMNLIQKCIENNLEKPSSSQIKIDDFDPYERQLALQVTQYHDQLWDCAQRLSPHQWVHYVMQLAKTYHLFYEHCPVLKAQSPELQKKRLWLVMQTQKTLKNALEILGITAPNYM